MEEFDQTFDVIPPEIRDVLVRVKINLPNRVPISFDYRPLTVISYDILEKQLETTPANFAFFGQIYAEQKMIVETHELNVKRRKSELSESILREAKNRDVALRRSDIADMIECDDDLLKMKARLIIEEKTLNKMQLILEAVRMKSEHLRSLAGFKKQELRDA